MHVRRDYTIMTCVDSKENPRPYGVARWPVRVLGKAMIGDALGWIFGSKRDGTKRTRRPPGKVQPALTAQDWRLAFGRVPVPRSVTRREGC